MRKTLSTFSSLTKYASTIGLVLFTVYLSVAINAYYRPIQETIHNGVLWAYEKNKTFGDILYETNGLLFNGKAFDHERNVKRVVFGAYSQVVMINTIPVDNTDADARKKSGRGTGWFYKIDKNQAYIVTNHHVIGQSHAQPDVMKVVVTTGIDMWQYDAEIIGIDEIADIAVIKISKKDNESWEVLEIEDPDDVSVGDTVAVVGHGMGLPYTATQGQVTYTGRYGSRPYNLMLQVDAVINQGNSGGPVINLDGKVVGVAQSILSPGRQIPGWDGIGFAVGAGTTQRSVDYIMSPQYTTKGYVPYAEIPFSMGSVEFGDVKDIPKEERNHAIIDYTSQTANSVKTVGELAGFEQGDVLLEVNGERVHSSFSILRKTIYAFPGDEWTVKVRRDGKEVTIALALRELDRTNILEALSKSVR